MDNLKEYQFRVAMTEIITAYTEAEARKILEGSNASADFHSVELEGVKELARER